MPYRNDLIEHRFTCPLIYSFFHLFDDKVIYYEQAAVRSVEKTRQNSDWTRRFFSLSFSFFFFFADEIYQSINQSGYFYLLKCYVYVLPFVILIWVWRTGKTETHTLSLFFFLWGYVSVLVVRCNVYCVLYIILTR